ncbi:hypothetical protein ACIQKB_22175 [Streptomyces sp. NPDC092046]|uniref:hypothetical protein n=1 Tax=Streptomyces sp. NPDC092046 TaxID=3366009 RepID=UPI0038261E14
MEPERARVRRVEIVRHQHHGRSAPDAPSSHAVARNGLVPLLLGTAPASGRTQPKGGSGEAGSGHSSPGADHSVAGRSADQPSRASAT